MRQAVNVSFGAADKLNAPVVTLQLLQRRFERIKKGGVVGDLPPHAHQVFVGKPWKFQGVFDVGCDHRMRHNLGIGCEDDVLGTGKKRAWRKDQTPVFELALEFLFAAGHPSFERAAAAAWGTATTRTTRWRPAQRCGHPWVEGGPMASKAKDRT